jgi:penicillin-binding protein 1A
VGATALGACYREKAVNSVSSDEQQAPDVEETGPPREFSETPRERILRLWRAFLLDGPDHPSRRVASLEMFKILLGLSALFGVMCGLVVVYSIDLPQMEELAKYRPNTTTELLDIHGREIGSFALERRVVVPYSDVPAVLHDAIISIEDKSFERNWGVNLFRAAEAAYLDVHSHSRAQGSSTLTMQLARNLFLSSQKTYSRKIQEIFLTVQIERRFTKQQIFTLYVNQIYLGHGRYGFEAGSEFYFSKHVKDLTLAEAALLAALPKGPEAYSPIRFPERAVKRRNLVLSEMEHDGKISARQAAAAMAEPLGLKIETPPNSIAPYFVEEVRRQLEKEYGVDEVHGAGLRVYTTLDLDLQEVANKAVLDGVARYERRHGWKGHLQNVEQAGLDMSTYRHPDWTQPVGEGDYVHGMVTEVAKSRVLVKVGAQTVELTAPDWAWTQSVGDSFLMAGDLVYVRVESIGANGLVHATLQQDSGVQSSLMAVDNSNGEVLAMVGGRDFALSQFNRATQAQRQVGSSFKPYVYTAALESGMKPTDIVVDAPTSFKTPSGWYTPHNYEPDWKGAMTLTAAFAQSRNIPALKLADKVGISTVIETARRFGIVSDLPKFLPIAIGAADITLAEQVGAYSVFPNDGIRIEPHYIRRVTETDGVPLDAHSPKVTEAISVETARSMMILLKAVTTYGTASIVSNMHHPFGGKTGTTNSFTDAWFVGFSPSVTCGVWIGFDSRESLGPKETGAKAALPIWMDFMAAAIDGKDDEAFPSADAPKKVLAVTPDSDDDKPTTTPDNPDTDSDDSGDAKPAPEQKTAPEPAPIPVAPPIAPAAAAPGPAMVPAKPAPILRVPAPAKSAAPSNGVSHPPPVEPN